eukprot:3744461-Rhodomonas_salina.2
MVAWAWSLFLGNKAWSWCSLWLVSLPALNKCSAPNIGPGYSQTPATTAVAAVRPECFTSAAIISAAIHFLPPLRQSCTLLPLLFVRPQL